MLINFTVNDGLAARLRICSVRLRGTSAAGTLGDEMSIKTSPFTGFGWGNKGSVGAPIKGPFSTYCLGAHGFDVL